jgi:hypothetical protein
MKSNILALALVAVLLGGASTGDVQARELNCGGGRFVAKYLSLGSVAEVYIFKRYTQNFASGTFKSADRKLQIGVDQKKAHGFVPRIVNKNGTYEPAAERAVRASGNMHTFVIEKSSDRTMWTSRNDTGSVIGNSSVVNYQTATPPSTLLASVYKYRMILDAGISSVWEETSEIVPVTCQYVRAVS